MKTINIPFLNRGLTAVPVYEEHHRGRNWCATITADPNAPGGLRREWWNTGRGDFFYILPFDLIAGTAIEFGADYITTYDNRRPNRWYGVVVDIKPTHLAVLQCASALEACRMAKDLQVNPQAAAASESEKIEK